MEGGGAGRRLMEEAVNDGKKGDVMLKVGVEL